MTAPSGSIAHTNTTHGTTYFYQEDPAAQTTMNAMVRAEISKSAEQSQQMNKALARLGPTPEIEPVTLTIIGTVIAGVGVAVAAAGVAASATSAASSVAGLLASRGDDRDILEIVIKNRMPAPVTLQTYDADSSSLVELCGPIAPGGADNVVLGGPGKGNSFEENDSDLTLNFLVGGGVTQPSPGSTTVLTPIEVSVKFKYSSNGDWVPEIAVDGGSRYLLSESSGGIAYFEGGSGQSVLDFCVLATVCRTSNGEVSIEFLPPGATLDTVLDS